MEYANALRELADRPTGLLVAARWIPAATLAARRERLVLRTVVRLGNLIEHAYLIGHDEGFVEGKVEGTVEGRDEVLCNRQTNEEWEHGHA